MGLTCGCEAEKDGLEVDFSKESVNKNMMEIPVMNQNEQSDDEEHYVTPKETTVKNRERDLLNADSDEGYDGDDD